MKKLFNFLFLSLMVSLPLTANEGITPQEDPNEMAAPYEKKWLEFYQKIDNSDIQLNLLKHYYYTAQHTPQLKDLNDHLLSDFDADEDNSYDLFLSIILITLSDIALQKYAQVNSPAIDLPAQYLQCGKILGAQYLQLSDQEEMDSVNEDLQTWSKEVFEDVNNANLITDFEKYVIANVFYDMRNYIQSMSLIIMGSNLFYPPFIDTLIESFIKDYAAKYKNMPLPPQDFLLDLGFSNKEITEMANGTYNYLENA